MGSPPAGESWHFGCYLGGANRSGLEASCKQQMLTALEAGSPHADMFGRAVALEREHLELGQKLSVALLREHLPRHGRGVTHERTHSRQVCVTARRTCRVGGRRPTSAGDSSSFSL